MSLLNELRRRNVIRVAIGYVALSWLVIQVVDTLFSIFDIPDSVAQAIVIVLAVGFVPALMIAWKFELTPEGLKRDAEADRSAPGMREIGNRWDKIVTAVLILAVGYFAIDKFVVDPARDEEMVAAAIEQVRIDELVASYGTRSIAVMPFVNMSDNKEQEYFADGITEELLNLLAKVGDLRVISRSSAFQYKGQQIHVPTVAEELKVAHVLEGSVRRDGDKIRVTAQLIDASDAHLWSDTYDRDFTEVFTIQDEIAAKVVDSLKVHLFQEAPTTRKRDPEVYALYLKAQYLLNQTGADATQAAKVLLQQALAIDPQDLDVLSSMARITFRELVREDVDLARERVMAIVATMRRIDPDDPASYGWDSWFAMEFDLDFNAGARGVEDVLRRAPTDPEVLRAMLPSIVILGAIEEAIAIGEYRVAMDPLCGQCQYQLARAYRLDGQFDEAIAAGRAALILISGEITGSIKRDIGRSLFLKGDIEAALENAIDAEDLQVQAAALHALGRLPEYEVVLKQAKAGSGATHPGFVAWIYAAIGENELAIEWLEKPTVMDPTSKARELEYWVYRNLRDDPRFIAMQEEIGVSPAQLEAINFQPPLPPGVTID